MRFLTSMHLALMFPSYYGAQTVGWMGVAMCLFGISGLILWWPRKGQWRAALLVKRGTKGFRLNRDLHGVIGFWSLPVFMILSLSGVYLVFPTTFGDGVKTLLPHESTLEHLEIDAATAASIVNPDALTPDEAAKLALAAVPGARLHSVQLPPGDEGTFMVTLMPHYAGEGAPHDFGVRGTRRRRGRGRRPPAGPDGHPDTGLDEGAPLWVGARRRLEGSCFPFGVLAAAVCHYGLAHVADPSGTEARRPRRSGGAGRVKETGPNGLNSETKFVILRLRERRIG